MPDNLHTFPLKGLDRFVEQLREHGITQISLTGTNTEPQLYAYESELRSILRERIPGVKISLHTNGLLVLRKIEVFNQYYDRAAISFPSFQPDTYHKLTGHPQVLDLAAMCESLKDSDQSLDHPYQTEYPRDSGKSSPAAGTWEFPHRAAQAVWRDARLAALSASQTSALFWREPGI